MAGCGGKLAVVAGVLALGAVSLGALMGVDAGSRVDAFYRTPSGPRYQRVAAPADSYRDWADSATFPATPPVPVPISDSSVRVDDGFTDQPPPRTAHVRVHRAAHTTRHVEDAPLLDGDVDNHVDDGAGKPIDLDQDPSG